MDLLFLEPIFKERIWGGAKLNSEFDFVIPSEHTGECWSISAHKNGETHIKNGRYAGMPLSKLWADYPEIFANKTKRDFPLMIKILDANDKLSVQVHPDDEYAKKVENDLGKAECWYVLDAKPGAHIIYGHNAKTIDEFKRLALNNKWQELLTVISVKKGDFFDVPTGTVHALGAGTLILEVQQSSDTTYRLYDYERRDNQGNLRDLHLDKSFDVIRAPHVEQNKTPKVKKIGEHGLLTTLTQNQYFQVQRLEINGALNFDVVARYLLVSVIDGNGTVNGVQVKKGDSFIVPNAIRQLSFSGDITLILSNES